MFVPALLTFLAAAFSRVTVGCLASPLVERPIFAGFLVGVLLGDIPTGILVGAQMELVFMGIINVGGGQGGADILGATCIAAAIAITQNMAVDAVLPLGITLSYAAYVFAPIRYFINELSLAFTDKALKEGNRRKFGAECLTSLCLSSMAQYAFVFFAVFFGGDIANVIMEKAPTFVIDGLRVAGGILPGIGLAMIISMLWNTKTAIFFFLGFFLVKYLSLDLIFLFVLALSVAIIELILKLEITENIKKQGVTSSPVSEEEGFLS